MSKKNIHISDLNFSDFILKDGESSRGASLEWDQRLGLKTLEVEERLYAKDPHDEVYESRAWMGLPFQTLQTPYDEILSALLKFKEQGIIPLSILDLGAAFGRVGIIAKLLFPECEFQGLEMVRERVEEGKRVYKELGLNPESLRVENILRENFELPKADIYFLYDFSDPADIKVILDSMAEVFFEEEFFLIAKGKAVNSLIQHKYPLFYASHGRCWLEHAVIYSSYMDVGNF